MGSNSDTIWSKLDECVQVLSEPFRAAEIISWFRRHHPDVKEESLRAHIQGATANVSAKSRGGFARRAPLITRIGHGLYKRAEQTVGPATTSTSPSRSTVVTRDAINITPRPLAGQYVDNLPDSEWHTEANVQAQIVTHLVVNGWNIVSVANTATKEQGLDVLARRGTETVGIEVKGYPSRFYADPARAGQRKPTQPPTQARVWYSSAIMSAMRLRSRQREMRAVIALPHFPTYRALYADTKWGLDQCGIEVWWVTEDGAVETS